MRDSRRVMLSRSYALAFAVALSPVMLQGYSCQSGNTDLSSLEFEVDGQNLIPCFDPNNKGYAVATSSSTAILTVQTSALSSVVTYQWTVEGETVESGEIGVGGGQVTLTVPSPESTLRVIVTAVQGAVAPYDVDVHPPGVVGELELLATSYPGIGFSDMAVAANGDTVVVWEEWDFDTGVLNAFESRRTSGAWGVAELLETDDAGHARTPQVAVTPNGDAVVVWSQHPGNIYANRLVSGAWSGPELVETISSGPAIYPHVAVYPNGDAVAVWQQHAGSIRRIYANRLISGIWGVPESLEPADSIRAEAPRVAVAANGDAVVVWEQNDDSPTGRDIYASRLTAGTWGGAELIDLGAFRATDPQVAVAPNGDAVVVWDQDIEINARRLTSGVWEAEDDLLNTPSGGVHRPQVAIDPDGNAVVVWQQFDHHPPFAGAVQNIYANHFTSAGWAGPELLEGEDGADAGGAFVALDPNGDAVAVWSQRICPAGFRNSYSNHLTSGVWGNAELIETIDGGNVSPIGVGVATNGNAVTALVLLGPSIPYSLYGTQLTSGP